MIEVNMQLHWGSRGEELDALVYKAAEYLAFVAGFGFPFETWVQPGKSRKNALAAPAIDLADHEQIRKLLLKGRNRTDFSPRTVIPELGYHFGLWNQALGDVDATVSLRCGVNSEFLNKDAQNLVSFRASARETLHLTEATIEQAFLRSAAIWTPQGGRAWIRRMNSEHTVSAI
jgi:hypothetical protein